MNITKAIIPVAGWGTRRLPITKTIEKCMLPVGNRPIVDYVVQDCIQAGITEIIFVVGEQSQQVRDYYDSNRALEEYLERGGKSDSLDLVAPPRDIKFHFVTQPNNGKYGTAVPIALVADYLYPDERAVVLMGDDFFHNPDGSSEVKRLIEGVGETENGIIGAVLPKDDRVTGRYGSIVVDERGMFIRIDEHPEVSPEPFIKNVSKYLLTYDMIQAVKDYVDSNEFDKEYYIFTPFERLLESGEESMRLVRAQGQYLDGGTVESWLYANQVIIGEDY